MIVNFIQTDPKRVVRPDLDVGIALAVFKSGFFAIYIIIDELSIWSRGLSLIPLVDFFSSESWPLTYRLEVGLTKTLTDYLLQASLFV